MASTIVARFGRRIAAERKRRGWTMAELSAKSAVGVTIISNLERGRQGCTLDSAVRLAAALEITLDGLTGPCGQCGDRPHPGFTCNMCNMCGTCGEEPAP